MQFGKAIISGIVLWAVVFAVSWVLLAMGLATDSTALKWILLVLWIVAVWVATYWYRSMDYSDAFVTGLIWLIVVAVLDYFITVKYLLPTYGATTTAFYNWSLWISYAVILLFPSLYKAMAAK